VIGWKRVYCLMGLAERTLLRRACFSLYQDSDLICDVGISWNDSDQSSRRWAAQLAWVRRVKASPYGFCSPVGGDSQ